MKNETQSDYDSEMGKSKLTAEQRDAITKDDRRLTVIAADYGVSRAYVSTIRKRTKSPRPKAPPPPLPRADGYRTLTVEQWRDELRAKAASSSNPPSD